MLFLRYNGHGPTWSFTEVCPQQTMKEPNRFASDFHKNKTKIRKDWGYLVALALVQRGNEVRQIIYALPTLQSHTFYMTLYSMGLRLGEATGQRHPRQGACAYSRW